MDGTSQGCTWWGPRIWVEERGGFIAQVRFRKILLLRAVSKLRRKQRPIVVDENRKPYERTIFLHLDDAVLYRPLVGLKKL